MSRTTAAVLLCLAAAGCGPRGSELPPLPPGPEDPAANLALYDRFAEEVRRQAQQTAWARDSGQETPATKTKGLDPLLTLRVREIEGWRRRLEDPAQRKTIRALEDFVFHTKAAAAVPAQRLVDRIFEVRAEGAAVGDPELDRYLMEAEDASSREQAWRHRAASAAELALLLRDLAEARNAWARAFQGAGDYLDLMRRRRGYDPELARRLYRQVAAALPAGPRRQPWDPEGDDPVLASAMADHLAGEELLPRLRDHLAALGLSPRPEGLSLVTAEGPARYWPYATYPVRPPADVRLLLTPADGIYPYWSSFHEIGHGAQHLLAPGEGPHVLRRPVSPAVSEAVAKLSERLVYSPEWLRRVGVPEELIEGLGAWERASERLRMRRFLAMIAFEERLYEDPGANLDTVQAKLWRDIVGEEIPFDVPAWAMDRSLAFDPLESWDYLLARCAQAAAYRRLRALPGGLLGDQARRVWREEILRPAAGSRYGPWFERSTGQTPSCTAWLEDVAGLRP